MVREQHDDRTQHVLRTAPVLRRAVGYDWIFVCDGYILGDIFAIHGCVRVYAHNFPVLFTLIPHDLKSPVQIC